MPLILKLYISPKVERFSYEYSFKSNSISSLISENNSFEYLIISVLVYSIKSSSIYSPLFLIFDALI